MDMVRPARRQRASLDLGIEALYVIRGQSVQPVCAESWDKVLMDVHPVTEMGVLRDVRRRGNVVDPVAEPAADCPYLARLADRALVALPFQRPDLLGDLVPGFAANVAPVRPTVVLHTNGDPAMPAVLPAARAHGSG